MYFYFRDRKENVEKWSGGLFKQDSIILYLLSRRAHVNSRDNYGSTPLHYAASKCNETAVVQLLGDKNIDLEVCLCTI